MDISPNASEVRRMVIGIFNDYCRVPVEIDELDERLSIENSRLVARSYRASGLFAMWLVEIGIVQFYDEQGNALRTLNLRHDGTAFDRAAA